MTDATKILFSVITNPEKLLMLSNFLDNEMLVGETDMCKISEFRWRNLKIQPFKLRPSSGCKHKSLP